VPSGPALAIHKSRRVISVSTALRATSSQVRRGGATYPDPRTSGAGTGLRNGTRLRNLCVVDPTLLRGGLRCCTDLPCYRTVLRRSARRRGRNSTPVSSTRSTASDRLDHGSGSSSLAGAKLIAARTESGIARNSASGILPAKKTRASARDQSPKCRPTPTYEMSSWKNCP
jgi:hypothetical protein